MQNEAVKKLGQLLKGKIPKHIKIDDSANDTDQRLASMLNQLFDFMKETHEFIIPLSQGKLDNLYLPSKNFLSSPFKELQSNLLHLTWQAKQVANGDYQQRVDFIGDFSEAFNQMVEALDNHETILQKKIAELEDALSHIQKLEGILPICCNCKRIKNDKKDIENEQQEDWIQIESYLKKKTEVEFSHFICPDCLKKLYPDYTNA